jgi:hypothetical protein
MRIRAIQMILLGAGLSFGVVQGVSAEPPAASPLASASKSKDPYDRDSPESCVYSFQETCRARNYARAAKYLDLRKLPQQQRLKDGSELAQQLCQILDRDTQFDVANLSQWHSGSRACRLVHLEREDDGFGTGAREAPIGTFDLAFFARQCGTDSESGADDHRFADRKTLA